MTCHHEVSGSSPTGCTNHTGTIIVNGEPMRYWLPAGVTPQSIGLGRQQ